MIGRDRSCQGSFESLEEENLEDTVMFSLQHLIYSDGLVTTWCFESELRAGAVCAPATHLETVQDLKQSLLAEPFRTLHFVVIEVLRNSGSSPGRSHSNQRVWVHCLHVRPHVTMRLRQCRPVHSSMNALVITCRGS